MKVCESNHKQIVYDNTPFDEYAPEEECPLCREVKRVDDLNQACKHYKDSIDYYKKVIYGDKPPPI